MFLFLSFELESASFSHYEVWISESITIIYVSIEFFGAFSFSIFETFDRSYIKVSNLKMQIIHFLQKVRK